MWDLTVNGVEIDVDRKVSSYLYLFYILRKSNLIQVLDKISVLTLLISYSSRKVKIDIIHEADLTWSTISQDLCQDIIATASKDST